MNVFIQRRCAALIARYQKIRSDVIRERIYRLSYATIVRHIKAALWKKHYCKKEEITSMSWDVLERVLNTYDKRKGPIALYFAVCATYIVNAYCAELNKERQVMQKQVAIEPVDVDDQFEEVNVYDLPQSTILTSDILESLIDLKEFRSTLSDEYREVFDDALMGRNCASRNKVDSARRNGFPATRYYEAKRVLGFIISYLGSQNK